MSFQPTPEQIAAIEALKAKYHRAWCKKNQYEDWFERLTVLWYNGQDYYEEGGGHLRQIRNTIGGFEWAEAQKEK